MFFLGAAAASDWRWALAQLGRRIGRLKFLSVEDSEECPTALFVCGT